MKFLVAILLFIGVFLFATVIALALMLYASLFGQHFILYMLSLLIPVTLIGAYFVSKEF